MPRVLASDHGGKFYAKRQGMIEPIFADAKLNCRCGRFLRRGRAAARPGWRLITATHNLLKLHRPQLAIAAAKPERTREGPRRRLDRTRTSTIRDKPRPRSGTAVH